MGLRLGSLIIKDRATVYFMSALIAIPRLLTVE
ncbi:hypothetical protein M2408_003699 [Sphingobacterium sp. BIGb0165]|nr:hypothetical protein [Sphingobacterium sp. BIGb0165]